MCKEDGEPRECFRAHRPLRGRQRVGTSAAGNRKRDSEAHGARVCFVQWGHQNSRDGPASIDMLLTAGGPTHNVFPPTVLAELQNEIIKKIGGDFFDLHFSYFFDLVRTGNTQPFRQTRCMV